MSPVNLGHDSLDQVCECRLFQVSFASYPQDIVAYKKAPRERGKSCKIYLKRCFPRLQLLASSGEFGPLLNDLQ